MTLYHVTYQPTKDVEALATKRGMTPSDGTSFWDWVDTGECIRTVCQTNDWSSATSHARMFAEDDVCGQCRIEEIVRVHWRGAPPTWETLSLWDVGADTMPNIDEPDAREELQLSAGDEVLA